MEKQIKFCDSKMKTKQYTKAVILRRAAEDHNSKTEAEGSPWVLKGTWSKEQKKLQMLLALTISAAKSCKENESSNNYVQKARNKHLASVIWKNTDKIIRVEMIRLIKEGC